MISTELFEKKYCDFMPVVYFYSLYITNIFIFWKAASFWSSASYCLLVFCLSFTLELFSLTEILPWWIFLSLRHLYIYWFLLLIFFFSLGFMIISYLFVLKVSKDTVHVFREFAFLWQKVYVSQFERLYRLILAFLK